MRWLRGRAEVFLAVLAIGAVLGLVACAREMTMEALPFRPISSIQEIMDAQIDPSADVIWDSVAYIATEHAVEDRRPHTDEEWQAVRRGAIALIEGANLLMMEGRRVAASDVTQSYPGEHPASVIQEHLSTTHVSFTQFAHVLQDSAVQALTAIDAKDAGALLEAGGRIDDACEACHVAYWYESPKR